MVALWKLTALLGCLITASNAFSTPHSTSFKSLAVANTRAPSPSALRLSYWGDGDRARYEDALQHNMMRTDLRMFLTQRALQSFIFLLVSCRDPHTCKWLEETYGLANFEEYHGSGALNVTEWSSWDSILVDMLHRPSDVVVVSARRRGRGCGGWSKNNPYLEDRFVEFNIDIDPVSLSSRIVSVREQIAREWVTDLATIVTANEMILASYHSKASIGRAEEECVDYENSEDCITTEDLVAPYSDNSDRRSNAFDRNAMILLSNSMGADGSGSSPHRKGNFDLVLLLATQESVHRVLRAYQEMHSEREVSFAWLREFYVNRVTTHFDGDQSYHRADDFMDELLMSSPTMREVGKHVELVDPLRIAEDIISMRSIVAQEWKEIATTIPQEHTGLRKNLLDKQMGRYAQPATEKEMKDSGEGGFE